MNEQLDIRKQGDQKALQGSLSSLSNLVQKPIHQNEASTKDHQYLTRRLPDRAIGVKDLITFALQSLRFSDVLAIIISCALVTLMGMFTPFITKQIYNDLIPSGVASDVTAILILLIAATVAAAFFGLIRSMLLLRFKDRINASLEAAVMARTFSMPPPFFRTYSSGDLSQRVSSVTRISQSLSDSILTSLLSLLFAMAYFGQIFHYAPALAAPSLIIIVCNVALSIIMFFLSRRINTEYMPKQARLTGLLYGLLGGMQKIKTSGAEIRAYARWAKAYGESRPSVYENYPQRFHSGLSMVFSTGGLILIYFVALRNQVSLSDFMAYTAAFQAVNMAVYDLTAVIPTLASIMPMLDLARPILETAPETHEDEEEVTSLSGAIEINNLSFRYGEDLPYVFRGLSLKVKAGEFVAIVGKSGVGKTTLARLLLGFERPETGSIFYDHHNLEQVNAQSIRKCIGTCLQDGVMFSGEILDNITITAPQATLEEAWDAARQAAIDDEIRAMPMGMHTLLTEEGGGISGGQRQRLLIARALINKPKILIMDEASSALDNIKQKQVFDNIAQLKCTRICIAHRLSTIVQADRIIVVDGGRVIEEGTYEQLVAARGFFYELTKKQQL